MPIFDNHIHLRAEFRGVEAARDFERAGGTAVLLTHSPYDEIPIHRAEDYDKAYTKTLAMAEAVRKATHLQVFVALGPYPVDFLGLQGAVGHAPAIEVMRSGIDRAAEHIAAQRAVAFGEVGRPHFPVSEEILAACNGLLEYTMSRARELGCARHSRAGRASSWRQTTSTTRDGRERSLGRRPCPGKRRRGSRTAS